jgi:aminopeptidase N
MFSCLFVIFFSCHLCIRLDGIDPDDTFSTIPYEKGSYFLFYLENLVGKDGDFESFMRAWIKDVCDVLFR